MSSQSSVIFPDVLRSINAATFTGSYQPVGAALEQPCRLIKFVNNTTVGVTISWDGINAHDYIPSNSFALYDVSTNRESTQQFEIEQGTQFYVLGSSGTGSLYITVFFGAS
jgi:hypothetical protein